MEKPNRLALGSVSSLNIMTQRYIVLICFVMNCGGLCDIGLSESVVYTRES